jgi:hypothetical protein
MEEIQVLQAGCAWLTPKPLTSKWHTWYYSMRDLLSKARKINAEWSAEMLILLKEHEIPSSWNGRNLIFPLTTKREWRGILRRRVVAEVKVSGKDLVLGKRFLCDGFNRDDFLLSVRLLGEE